MSRKPPRIAPTRRMKVTPYQSCIGCYRGDTTTVFLIEGEAEFIIAGIHKAAGLSLDEASATFQVIAGQEMGCDPGMVPVGRMTVGVRLCRECAAKTGTTVSEIGDDGAPGYRQPDDQI